MHHNAIRFAFLAVFAVGCNLSSGISKPEADPLLSVPQTQVSLDSFDSLFYIEVVNAGGYHLRWCAETDVPWLEMTTDAILSRAKIDTLRVEVRRSGLQSGTYHGEITVTQLPAGPSKVVNVTLRLPEALIAVSDGSLSFGSDVDTLIFQIVNLGVGKLSWSAWSEESWVKVTPSQGHIWADTALVMLTVGRDSIPPGNYMSTLWISSNGGAEIIPVTMQEGREIWRCGFDDNAQLHQIWDIWDEDSSATYGIDKWGVVEDTVRGESVAWCNGDGAFSTRRWGYDGGIRTTMLLRPEQRPDVMRADFITVQFYMLRELASDSDIVRVAINGVGGFTTEAWTNSSAGWEQLRYSFDNRQHFLQPVNIQFIFISIVPADGFAGAKVDDVEVWVK